MFDKIFKKKENLRIPNKTVHCEITGQVTDISNTIGLAKINGILLVKNFRNPRIDLNSKLLFSDGKPPQKFYSELEIPDELKRIFGPLLSVVDDEDEIEQSTAIMSLTGRELFIGQGLIPFIKHFENDNQGVRIPDTMFHCIIDNNVFLKNCECENWNINYKTAGNKYRFKKILKEKKEKQTYGMPNILFFRVLILESAIVLTKTQMEPVINLRLNNRFKN